MEIGRLLSLITVIQILISVLMTIRLGKVGYFTFLFLYSFNIFGASRSMIMLKNLNSTPGIFMNAMGILIISLIYDYCTKLSKIAYSDELTKLYNQRKIVELAEQKIASKKRFAFVLADLDNFKQINELRGHAEGDHFLCQFAEYWSQIADEEHAFCARIGGDEFVMIKPLKAGQTKEEFCDHLRHRIYLGENSLNQVFKDKKESFAISTSCGVSFYPDDCVTFSDLYRYADLALYQAKSLGKESLAAYNVNLLNTAYQDNVMEQRLRTAILDEDLFMVYQPQFSAKTMKVAGAEALVRMRGKDGNIVPPIKFIPVAEKTNLIVELDFYVIRKSLETFLPMLKENQNLLLSVNLSVKTLSSDQFLSKLDQIITEVGFPTENLQIELTESLMISGIGRTKAKELLSQIHSKGIQLAIDDYGTGYSSLSYLKDLPFDTLKIDKAFVDCLSENPEDNAFVKAIITTGHILHMKVVSEGVETKSQLAILQAEDCDIIQGYLCGKPMELEQFEQLLQ